MALPLLLRFSQKSVTQSFEYIINFSNNINIAHVNSTLLDQNIQNLRFLEECESNCESNPQKNKKRRGGAFIILSFVFFVLIVPALILTIWYVWCRYKERCCRNRNIHISRNLDLAEQPSEGDIFDNIDYFLYEVGHNLYDTKMWWIWLQNFVQNESVGSLRMWGHIFHIDWLGGWVVNNNENSTKCPLWKTPIWNEENDNEFNRI